jgi:molybdopterin synthase sulfur carrier subunit
VPVTVKIPPQLRSATGGRGTESVGGATVGEVLGALYDRHGELRDRVADPDGGLRRFVNVYLDGEDVRFLDGMQTPVPDGAELQILPAVAGGGGAGDYHFWGCRSACSTGTTPSRTAT